MELELHPSTGFDNSARDYEHIEALPLAAAMGAEIRDVQIGKLTDAQFAEIEDALYRHKMIFFRDQDMTHADQENFTLRFGDFGIDAYTKGVPGHRNVQPVIKEADTRIRMLFGSGWHTDSPFMETPPAISMLFGADIPPYGGDTMWCNTVLAYNCLSDTMRQVLAPLRVHMTAVGVVSELQKEAKARTMAGQETGGTGFGNIELDINTNKMVAGWYHPIVRTHPKTGEKALYVDQTYSHGIQGMTPAEAEALLRFLKHHVSQPAFSCRLRWEPKTFTVWDNRICVHQAFNDYDGFRREMYRTTVLGEVPR
ncbi:MAG: TauD/TfdA family dioxygenase [Betaproteobacteria bacterium]|jgi:taurine dioxygenase|nr:MAG: TauD/TfdA family dioxygenase [Betaproteobacteria bacterium]